MLNQDYQLQGLTIDNIFTSKIKAGDIYLLTSDGIHDNLLRSEIEGIAGSGGDIARHLVNDAYKISKKNLIRSKPDDMTVVVIKCMG